MNIAEEYDGRDAYIDKFDFYSPTAAQEISITAAASKTRLASNPKMRIVSSSNMNGLDSFASSRSPVAGNDNF